MEKHNGTRSLLKQVYRRRYESRRSSKPKLHSKPKKIKYGEKRFSMADGILTPCNVAGGSGMTCHWIRPNVRHIGILHLVSIPTTSPQSTCHSAPVSEMLSKSDHPRQKKITSCRLSRWRISAILDFMDPIMGSLNSYISLSVSDCMCAYVTAWSGQCIGQVLSAFTGVGCSQHLSLDCEGHVLVADDGNRRILLMTSQLRLRRILTDNTSVKAS